MSWQRDSDHTRLMERACPSPSPRPVLTCLSQDGLPTLNADHASAQVGEAPTMALAPLQMPSDLCDANFIA
jgi:hypothetical protein